MNMSDRNPRYQQPPPPPPHRRKTPSFSSSLLDSILRSIDETNGGEGSHHHPQVHHHHDLMFFASEPKRSGKIRFSQEDEQMPSLRRAIMIDQWMDIDNNNNNNTNNMINTNNYNGYGSRRSCRKFSSDSSCSGTTMFTASSASSETETPSTYRSLPNSFTISKKTAEAVFLDDTPQKASSSTKPEGKFMKLTKLRAMKIYGDLKKVKQPISPGSRISAFIYSLFASSSSSKKAKIEESMQNFRSLKKSRSIKQDHHNPMTCTSFSRSCMSKKQHSSSVKRSVRFYPENDTVIPDRKSSTNIPDRKSSTNERGSESDTLPLPKYERRWFTEKNYTRNYKNFMVNNIEDDDELDHDEEDDLFELEIVGGVATGAYRQELPVFETTDLRKIRI